MPTSTETPWQRAIKRARDILTILDRQGYAVCEVYPDRDRNEWISIERAEAVRHVAAALVTTGNNSPETVPPGDGGAKTDS